MSITSTVNSDALGVVLGTFVKLMRTVATPGADIRQFISTIDFDKVDQAITTLSGNIQECIDREKNDSSEPTPTWQQVHDSRNIPSPSRTIYYTASEMQAIGLYDTIRGGNCTTNENPEEAIKFFINLVDRIRDERSVLAIRHR